MKGVAINELFDLNETMAGELFAGKTYPWECLDGIHDFILKLGPTLPKEEYEQKGEDIWIARDAVVYPTVHITGPCIIGKGTEVRQCAFIRGNALVGENCVVGNSTELKNVILFNHVEVPHYNYVGDSILGFHAHMGAGSITSNVKAKVAHILVEIKSGDEKIPTGRRKVGAMLGDYADIGCGSVLNPGTVIGPHTNVYPLCSVRGVVPGHSIYKDKDTIVPKVES